MTKIRNKSEDVTSGSAITGTTPGNRADTSPVAAYSLAALIGLITLLTFLPALHNGFVFGWDDSQYVLDNLPVHSLSWKFFRWAFTDTSVALYWHPLTWISHAVDYALWKTDPFGHHLTSVLLHALNAGVVVLLTTRLLGAVSRNGRVTVGTTSLERRHLLIISGIAGLLFGIHPLRVESAAWIAMRKDLLYALFYMLSIMSYFLYVRGQERSDSPTAFYLNRNYYAALMLFFLALCSKPMAVTLPAALLLFDWYPLRRFDERKNLASVITEKIPFFALSGIVSVVAVIAQNSAEGLRSYHLAPFVTRLPVICRALMMYLWKIIAPVNLMPLYPYPKGASLTKPLYLSAILLVAVITTGCIFIRKKSRLFLTVWAFFIISLLPVIGILQAGGQFMADRHVYIASIGPFILLGTGFSMLWKRADNLKRQGVNIKSLLVATALVITVSLSWLSVRQISIWQSALVLWSHYIDNGGTRFPDAYYDRAEEFRRLGFKDRAVDDYNAAIATDPEYGTAYINRGVIFLEKGLLDQALEDFKKAVELEPRAMDARLNLGNAYKKMGKPALALEAYNTVIAKKPTFTAGYVNRGIVYKEMGEINRAIEDFSKALTLQPELAKIFIVRGDLYSKTGTTDLAIRDYQAACQLGDSNGCDKAAFPFQINSPGPTLR